MCATPRRSQETLSDGNLCGVLDEGGGAASGYDDVGRDGEALRSDVPLLLPPGDDGRTRYNGGRGGGASSAEV